ncbi:hypothetical protein C8R44DRAFT_753758 [Mycena epipterygia]|nr:hypothetical protein C8R44DRAFT_753758 [Mycena epipterygia]
MQYSSGAASAPIAASKAIPADCMHVTAFGAESDSDASSRVLKFPSIAPATSELHERPTCIHLTVGWGAGKWRKGVGDRHMGIGREEKDVAERQSTEWDAPDVAGCGVRAFHAERSVQDVFRGHSEHTK